MSIILEYIWLDGISKLRSKFKTIYHDNINFTLKDVPNWNYDGSSTFQATTENSEIILVPCNIYKNPFFQNNNSYLVLCDTYYRKNNILTPTDTNHRNMANKIFNMQLEMEPWYGIEQEYFMMSCNNTHDSDIPIMFITDMNPMEQGNYYCGVGNQHITHRFIAERHYRWCLYAGLKISGINAEVAPNQWEYQIGPCVGIEAGDQLWVSRYILHRLSEDYNVNISFKPKPLKSPWNGSGLHTNFSTKDTREVDGLNIMAKYIELMKPKHMEHMAVYGDNSERLCGMCETSKIDEFTCGYGNRGCSIRIPTDVIINKQGYFEDRRPAADADPYLVSSIIFKTCCLE